MPRPCTRGRATVKGVTLHPIELGHSFVDLMPFEAGSSAQRIRIGLTGLAFAFLLVLLGSIISRSGREENANRASEVTSNEPNEPLAELGVAPGASTSDTNNSAAAQKK
jgi:hypothetical protein